MTAQTSLVNDLRSIVGSEHVRRPEEPPAAAPAFIVDGLLPQAIVQPGTYDEVAEVMRYANEASLAVIPCGHGRMPDPGNVPRHYDIALSVARLNQIIEYEPADLTMTCQAGATLGDLHAQLSEAGQMTPFGLADNGACIGALLARNRSHNLQYGSPRDYTIGMRVITAEGLITRAGRNVVKNVAGYDLCKLYVGSLGTLGVIVEASIKLVPLPQARQRVDLEFGKVSDASTFAKEAHGRGLSLSAINLRRHTRKDAETAAIKGAHVLEMEMSGGTVAVQRTHREILQMSATYGAQEFYAPDPPDDPGQAPSPGVDGPLQLEASVLPSFVPDLIDRFQRESLDNWVWWSSPVEGRVDARWNGLGADGEMVRRLRAHAADLGGTLIVTNCSLDLKRRIDVFGDPPPAFDLMRRIKEQFDPKGTLSPGRFVGRL